MKLTAKEKETLEIIRNITHEPIDRINNVLLGLMTHALLSYTEKESIVIPYFGSFFIRYLGDEVSPDGKEAILENFFEPSLYLKENIGSYEDFKKNSNGDIDTIPIFKHLASMNEQTLRVMLNDEFVKEP